MHSVPNDALPEAVRPPHLLGGDLHGVDGGRHQRVAHPHQQAGEVDLGDALRRGAEAPRGEVGGAGGHQHLGGE